MPNVGEQDHATLEELLVSSLATSEALAKLLIEKGVISESEFVRKLSVERVGFRGLLRQKINY